MMSQWELRRERVWDLAFIQHLEWDGISTYAFKAQVKADRTVKAWEAINPKPKTLNLRFWDWVVSF